MNSTLLIVNPYTTTYEEFGNILREFARFIDSGDIYYQQQAVEVLARKARDFLENNKYLSEMDYSEVVSKGLQLQDHLYIFVGDIFWQAMTKIGEEGKFFQEFTDEDITAFLGWLLKTIDVTMAAYLASLDMEAVDFLRVVNDFLREALQQVYCT